MKDKDKTKEQLINNIIELNQRIEIFERLEAERKQTEEVPQRQSAKLDNYLFQTLMENYEDFIYFKDKEAKFYRVSKRFYDFFGLTEKNIIGKTDFDLFPKDLARQTYSEDMNIINTGIPLINKEESTAETTVITTKYPWRDSEGNIVGLFGISRDITKRKQMAEKLKKSEEHYRIISDNTSDVITIIDFDLNPIFIYVSPSIRAYGYEPEELIGKSCFDLIHLDDKKQLLSLLQHYITLKVKGLLTGRESSIVETIEFRAKDKSGNWRHLHSTTNLVGNQILIINRDITESKQIELEREELYKREQELRQSLEDELKRRAEFSRALVHELKTPLTPILVASELLLEEAKEGTMLRLAASISRNALTMSNRIETLLDLAKNELGVFELARTEVNSLQLLNKITNDMSIVANGRELSLALDVPPSLPTLWADENRLEQVILNLIVNAFKWSPPGGTVTLRAREKDTTLVVEVQDEGTGITNGEQERIFEMYYRTEDDRQRIDGLGLGLALCKTIIEAHGGKIWVESKVGKGSIFSFSISLLKS
ncbi:PAS domain S-box protein [Chloroflexota bacterium]